MTSTPTYVLNNNNRSENYYRKFKQSIKSNETFVTYDHRLKAYTKYRGFTEYSQLIGEGKDVKQIENEIIDFIFLLLPRKDILML
jgi:hypothetical protein